MACWNPMRCDRHGPYRGHVCPVCEAEDLQAEGVEEWGGQMTDYDVFIAQAGLALSRANSERDASR